MFEGGLRKEGPEFFQEMVGKATTACTKFDDVDWVVGVEGGLPIAQETKDYFGVGIGDEGIAGDVMGNRTVFPGVNAL